MASTGHTMNNSAIHANRDANLVSNVTYNNYGPQISPGPDPMTILQEQVAFGALHDSAERFDAPKCHPETRTAVLNLIDQWAKDRSEGAKPLFWLTGAAGAGKSAIAQTLIERWKQEDILPICFFFWRTSSERNQKTKLVSTLSYQLSEHSPSAKAVIKEAIGAGGIFKKNLEVQFEELLLRPLVNIPQDQPPVIVVIDGLDECCVDIARTAEFAGQDFKSQQREILDALATACQKAHPPRVLIVSRPEQPIRESFGGTRLQEITHRLSLNDAPDADKDILLYLQCGFEDVRRSYPSLPSGWPREDQIAELVRRSSGQFIYPSTVVKYIAHRRQYPEKSLHDVLDLRTRSKSADPHPLADLDQLYALILNAVSIESIDTVQLVLGILVYLIVPELWSTYCGLRGESMIAKSPYVLEKLLFLSHGEVIAHLSDLHSILHIPAAENPHDAIRTMHATLSEYLQDLSRSKGLHIAPASFYPRLCLITLRHLGAGKQEAISTIDKMSPDDIGMYYYLSTCLNNSVVTKSYSKQVKDLLWNLLEDEIGVYTSLIVNNKCNSRFGVELHNCSSCGHTHHVTIHFKLDTLQYLLGCNNSAFEPSRWRRYFIKKRLVKADKIMRHQMKALQEEYRKRGKTSFV